MEYRNGGAPFSNRFIIFWGGWFIFLFILPMLVYVIKGNYRSLFPASFMFAIWDYNALRIMLRNTRISQKYAFIIAITGIVIVNLGSMVINELYWDYIFMHWDKSPMYNLYRSIGNVVVVGMVIIPVVTFILILIYRKQRNEYITNEFNSKKQ